LFDSRLKRFDVADIAGDEQWPHPRLALHLAARRTALSLRNVNEGDLGFLTRKASRNRGSYATTAAGDEDRLVGKAGIYRGSVHESGPQKCEMRW
jgi:hypothetical protein